MLKGRKVLLGITGGIAAYKAVDLASKLIKSGAEVKVIMTKNACEFITPLSLKSITHNSVSVEMFNLDKPIEHITLADWAEMMIIAPATANILAKAANGIADDLLSTTILAMTKPILFVPAMNVHMYENAVTQENIKKLSSLGHYLMEPETGKLACGYTGKGRFPLVDEIVYHLEILYNHKQDLKGKKILITAGACRESLDPMRFLSNNSSGKTGLALARAAYIRGAEVKLIMGHVDEQVPYCLEGIEALSAAEMHTAVMELYPETDIVFMAAAVTDYTFPEKFTHKLKKTDHLELKMTKTIDILEEMGKKKVKQILVGFAAETENIEENARKKMSKKNLDFVAANNINVAGKQETSITLIDDKDALEIKGSKLDVANQIIDKVMGKTNDRNK